MKRISVLFVVFLALTAVSAHALEVYPKSNWEKPEKKSVPYFKPAAYFMFGVDYRTNDHTRLYVTPGFIADLLLQLNPAIGLKGGIGYNAHTKYSGVEGIRTFSADIALHLELPTGGVQPFLEGGIRYMKYEETGSKVYRTEGKTGLFAGLGLSIPFRNQSRIDFGINALLNNFGMVDYEGELPDDIGEDISDMPIDGFGSHKFARRLYNPLTVEIELRLKL